LHSDGPVTAPDPPTTPVRRGYLILAGLFILGLVTFHIEGIRDLLRSDMDIVALLPDAPTLAVGTGVHVEGVKVGRVTGVEVVKLGDTAVIAMNLRVEPQTRRLVTAASDVSASRRRFIGETMVRLHAGQPGEPPLQSGDTLRGRARPAPADLLEQAAALPPILDSLMGEVRVVQSHLDRAEPRVQALMGQLQATGEAVSAFGVAYQDGSLARMLDPQTGFAPRIGTLQIRVRELQSAVAGLGERYSGDGELAGRVEGLTARAAAVDQALADLATRMEEGGGFLWRVQADTALEVAARGVQAQVDSLMAEALSIALRMFLP
jgi:hypothetical protein